MAPFSHPDILQANSRHSTPAGSTSQPILQGEDGEGGLWLPKGLEVAVIPPRAVGSPRSRTGNSHLPPASPGGSARAAAEGPRPLSAPGRVRRAAAELSQLS